MAHSLAGQPLKVEDEGETLGPVTEFDRELDRYVGNGLRQQCPTDMAVSEGSPVPASDLSARIWYIDPIDRNIELISENDEWTILIRLAQLQRPVLGVVYRPANGLLEAVARASAGIEADP